MANLPKNFVTQREEQYLVTVQSGPLDDAAAEVMWSGTTEGTDVTVTKEVDEDQKDLLEVYARVDEAAADARDDGEADEG